MNERRNEEEAAVCDHGASKSCTYLDIFNDIADVYMCECGAIIDIDSERGMQDKPMTPKELTELVQELIDEKVKAIKAKVLSAIEGA